MVRDRMAQVGVGVNDGYGPTADYVFGPPPPVLEQPEPDTASESHTTVPTPHESSPKRAPAGLLTPISPPTSTNPLPQTNYRCFLLQ
jgi:hypothetical protein